MGTDPDDEESAQLSVRACGLLLLLTVVFIWVGSGLLIQYIYTGGEGNPAPLFLTYYSTVLFVVLLIPAYFEHK